MPPERKDLKKKQEWILSISKNQPTYSHWEKIAFIGLHRYHSSIISVCSW